MKNKFGSISAMFKGCTKLSSINLGSFNTSQVTSISQMFKSLAQTDFEDYVKNNPKCKKEAEILLRVYENDYKKALAALEQCS